jgi:predicted dehydrogenase
MIMKMRYGLIGCGGIGALRAAALKKLDRRLVAVSDINKDRAAVIAAQTGAAVDPSWQDLIHRPDIDAVLVSTPPSLHKEMVIAALSAGKHVLCEKPLALNPGECRSMIAAARKHDRFLATGFNYRFYPSILKAKELLDSGIIGELNHVRSYAGYSAADHPFEWLHDPAVVGGGALRDNGIHMIDLTRYFLGEVAEVRGFASSDVWRFSGCEDNGLAVLKSTEGKLASMHASWTEWRGYKFEIEVFGTLGCIRTRIFPMWTQMYFAKHLGGKSRRQSFWYPMTHLKEHLWSYKWIGVESFLIEFQEFESAVEGRKSSIGTGFDGLRAIEIACEAAGSPQASPSPCDHATVFPESQLRPVRRQ